MNASAVLLLVGVLLLAGCSKKQTAAPAPDQSASGNPLTAPVDYLGAVDKAKKHSEKVVDIASVNQAVQLFYAQEDRFPQDLNELVSKHYIAGIPEAPAASQWAYNRQTGQIKSLPKP